jgi:hypothetical protein
VAQPTTSLQSTPAGSCEWCWQERERMGGAGCLVTARALMSYIVTCIVGCVSGLRMSWRIFDVSRQQRK